MDSHEEVEMVQQVDKVVREMLVVEEVVDISDGTVTVVSTQLGGSTGAAKGSA